MDSNINYGETLCEAMDIIAKERLASLQYDTTIICTIVDDSRKKEGVYKVSNGSANFDAYSSVTDYHKGNCVYVQIPNSDMNEQKIIVAKCIKGEENKPFIYQDPFSNLVDITGNLINGQVKGALVANEVREGKDETSLILWTYNLDSAVALRKESGIILADYTRLGIKASFSTWLDTFQINNGSTTTHTTQGEYGLRLTVIGTTSEVVEGEEEKLVSRPLYLNVPEMKGNPYNFESYYEQEVVFDVSSFLKIMGLQLELYQKSRTFQDSQGNLFPHLDFLGNLVAPNIFVKDPYICVGYDTNEFKDEMIKVYTLDTPTYNRERQPADTNHKKLHMRWIHKLEDGSFTSIDKNDDLDYEVYWYRYELGHKSADEYSGVYWKHLSSQITKNKISNYEILDPDWIEYNNQQDGAVLRSPDFFQSWARPDTNRSNEKYNVIVIYNGKHYISNEFVLINEKEVPNYTNIEIGQALTIHCDDNSNGNYRIYNIGNELMNYADGNKVRTLSAYFNGAPLTDAAEIEWIIPNSLYYSTMIEIDENFLSQDTVNDETQRPIVDSGSENGNYKDGNIHILRYGNVNQNYQDGNIFNQQSYRIGSYYSQEKNNNTIQCRIKKNNIEYLATKELVFGPAGTSGTDVTFVLNIGKGLPGPALNEPLDNEAIIVTAHLYDYENKEIDLSKHNIEWSWKSANDIPLMEFNAVNDDNMPYQKQIRLLSNNMTENYHILQAKLVSWGDYDLIAYLPIPIRANGHYSYINGTTDIIYNALGQIDAYFKNAYEIYYNENPEDMKPANRLVSSETDKIEWEVIVPQEEDEEKNEKLQSYIPKMILDRDGEYHLQPLSIYVANSNEQVCVVCKRNNSIVWSQPILIMQNRYPSRMLNEWDGNLIIDEENNAILAAKIAAGRKENDNTFSGVILGDWQESDNEMSINQHTGLYGFNKGEQTYGFRDNGTAFIGKSGNGRIEFDGSSGRIYSAAYYDQGTGGTLLDLVNGRLYMRAPGSVEINRFESDILELESEENNKLYGRIMLDSSAETYPVRIGVSTENSEGAVIDARFKISWDGKLYAHDGYFEGQLKASDIYGSYIDGTVINGGYIKGTHIFGTDLRLGGDITEIVDEKTNKIIGYKSEKPNLIISSSGQISSGPQKLDELGNLDYNLTISPSGYINIKSGTINLGGNFIVSDKGHLTIRQGSITLGGSKFTVNNEGYMTATYGRIGGWNIDSDSLYSGQVYLDSKLGEIRGAIIRGATVYAGILDSTLKSRRITLKGYFAIDGGALGALDSEVEGGGGGIGASYGSNLLHVTGEGAALKSGNDNWILIGTDNANITAPSITLSPNEKGNSLALNANESTLQYGDNYVSVTEFASTLKYNNNYVSVTDFAVGLSHTKNIQMNSEETIGLNSPTINLNASDIVNISSNSGGSIDLAGENSTITAGIITATASITVKDFNVTGKTTGVYATLA